MGLSASKDEVEVAAAHPACVFDSVSKFNGSNLDGAVIRTTGLLLDCPSHDHVANILSPSEQDGKLAVFLPTGASSNACPGDRVECTVVRLRNHSYFARLDVSCRGTFGLELDRHGAPEDFMISFSRYLNSCGVRAQQDQQASWVLDSNVFQKYFKGRKVHWSGVVRKVMNKEGNCVLLDADILQSSGAAFDEPVRLDFDGPMSVHARNLEPGCHIRFDAVIASQGGQCLSWHTFNVTRLCPEAEQDPVTEAPGEAGTRADEEGETESRSLSSLGSLSISELKSIVRNHGGNADMFLEKRELVVAARAAMVENMSGTRREAATSASHESTDRTDASVPYSSKRKRPDSSSLGSSSSAVDDDGDQCVICQDSVKTHAFVPCGHRCVCEPCGRKVVGLRSMKVCPLCRQGVTCTMRIFT